MPFTRWLPDDARVSRERETGPHGLGGLQKEAYVLRIPCITVSAQTAWEETVELGWNRLVPPNAGDIAAAISGFTGGQRHEPVYGRGDACGRIRDAFRAVLA